MPKEKSHAAAKRTRYTPFVTEIHLETILRHNFTSPHIEGFGAFFLLLARVEAVCLLWRAIDLDSNLHVTQKHN